LSKASLEILTERFILFAALVLGPAQIKEIQNVIIIVLDITNPDSLKKISSLKTEQEENPFICDMKLDGSFFICFNYL